MGGWNEMIFLESKSEDFISEKLVTTVIDLGRRFWEPRFRISA
jgi:hypothetical protein